MPIVRPVESDPPPPKPTRKGTIRYLLFPSGQVSIISQPYQVSYLIWRDVRTVDTASDWLISYLDIVNNGLYK